MFTFINATNNNTLQACLQMAYGLSFEGLGISDTALELHLHNIIATFKFNYPSRAFYKTLEGNWIVWLSEKAQYCDPLSGCFRSLPSWYGIICLHFK